ncbi:MAG: DUF3822 family protein [Flavobacteriia bacterium]|nr:DUF3822 family protein [Flavobacteriia bacterium]
MSFSYYFLISEEFVSFYTDLEGEIQNKDTLFFSSCQQELQKEELNDFIKKLELDFSQCKQILVSYYSGINVLMPSSAFDINQINSYFSFCFENPPLKEDLDFNRLYLSSIVNVFYLPNWIKKFWILRFSKVQIKHFTSVQINGIASATLFGKHLHLSIFENQIHLLMYNQQEIVFQNSFDFQTAEDIVYYLSFCIEQEGLSLEKKIRLFYYNYNFSQKELLQNIQEKCAFFKLFETAQWKDSSIHHINYLQHCVS